MLLALRPPPPLLSAALPLKLAGAVAARNTLPVAGVVTEAVVGKVQSLTACVKLAEVLVLKLVLPP